MENENKDKRLFLVVTLIGSLGIILSFILYANNRQLQGQIDYQNRLLSDTERRDSAYSESERELNMLWSDLFNSEFYRSGDTLTAGQFIDVFNEINSQNKRRADSIRFYLDIIDEYESALGEYQAIMHKMKDLYDKYEIPVDSLSIEAPRRDNGH